MRSFNYPYVSDHSSRCSNFPHEVTVKLYLTKTRLRTLIKGKRWYSWLRRDATSREAPGLIRGRFLGNFKVTYSFCQ